ncbi:MAG TPA: type II toxin-antitoxin system HicA family toxin [Gemmataceae bacterium]|nr:type II toxin-antitoxin system HicA family toxin [Gemmataceae bacterium]
MSKLPVLSHKKWYRAWKQWASSRYGSGAHKQFRHADGRGTTVPFHKGRDISPVLLRKIARDIGMSVEDLVAANG